MAATFDLQRVDLTIAGLQLHYRAGDFTPAQLVRALSAKAERLAHHRVWIRRFDECELAPYLERLQTLDPEQCPLWGVPFAIKDNIDLQGCPTTAACPAFAYEPAQSAFVVERLLAAGAIPLGKTNLDQFATGLVGTRSPEPFGICRNSIDPDYISGGSSSGSAVAVAQGLVSFSLGTDTAGSGRVPAAFNNILGLKPSRGVLSTSGVVPACRSLDCVSLFALNTDDLDLLFDLTAVYDQNDCFARSNPLDNQGAAYGDPASRGFRFGVPAAEQLEFFGNGESARLFQAYVESLQALGGEAEVIDFAPFLTAARLLYEGPWVAERYLAVQSLLQQSPEALLPVTRSIIESALERSAADSFRAQYQLQALRQQAHAQLSRVDFLVTPTAGTLYRIDEVLEDPIRLNSNLGYYTNYMNLLDCAAVALPAGFYRNGLPFGVTLTGPALTDKRLLSFARLLQRARALPVGAEGLPTPQLAPRPQANPAWVNVAVCGAHLDGLPLNWQLRDRGGYLLETTTTAPHYRFYALAGGPPYRPGLIRVEEQGAAIEVEVWRLPVSQFGSFVAGIPRPLGIGKVELADGRWENSFICEGYAVANAADITAYGGWRAYLARREG